MKEKGRNIYDHFIAQDLLSYLRIAQGCATRADYLRVSNRPYRNISREAFGAEASLPALKKYYEDLTAGSLDGAAKGAESGRSMDTTDGICKKYGTEACNGIFA